MALRPRFQFTHKEHTQWTADTYEIALWLLRLCFLVLSFIPFLARLYNEVHKIKALCGAHSYMSVCLSAWFNLLHYLAEFDEADITGSALEMSDKCTSGSSRSSVACIVNRHTDLIVKRMQLTCTARVGSLSHSRRRSLSLHDLSTGHQFARVSFSNRFSGIAQSVQRLATGWTVRRSNPGRGEILRTRPDRPWVFPGGKAAGACRWPPTPSSAEVKERVEPLLPFWTVVANSR
jgi:hypothetical protein